jgi:hypothetical protein
MIYQDAANRLAAQGRSGDTTLVHMSPGEVKGLQALAMAHGGSLSINPSTGLPEAGFLSSILPVIGGAALTAMGVPPPFAAMIMGGGTALATGDISKGLSAGLGAYGGAGLGSGLMGAGQAAAASAIPPEAVHFSQTGAELAGSPFSTMGQGLSSLVDSGAAGEAARSGFMRGVGGLGGLAKSGLAAAAPMLMGGMGQGQQPTISQTPIMNRLEYQARPTTPTPRPDVPGYGDLGRDFGREQRYYDGRYVDTGRRFVPGDFGPVTPMPMPMADGGLAGTVGGNVTYPLSSVPSAQLKSGIQDPQQANVVRNTPVSEVDPYTGEPRFAAGGVSHLGDYSDGGRMLRGPGDGVSDSIPATIGGKQPARLADGEFVIPARIVSEIGNGSSEAGARKLYAMMDRIQNVRKKTVGKDRVAVNTKADKLLPA